MFWIFVFVNRSNSRRRRAKIMKTMMKSKITMAAFDRRSARNALATMIHRRQSLQRQRRMMLMQLRKTLVDHISQVLFWENLFCFEYTHFFLSFDDIKWWPSMTKLPYELPRHHRLWLQMFDRSMRVCLFDLIWK